MKLDSSERTLVFDIESNGLLHKVTKLWCLAATDYHTGEMFLFHDYPEYDGVSGVDDEGNEFTLPVRNGSMKGGALFIHKAKSLICHNILGYDLFLLKKFFPKFKIRYAYPEIRDTLLESQVLFYDRKPVKGYKGIHGLSPWGARLGIRKPGIEDWSFIDANKIWRCIQDIEINVAVAREMDAEKVMLMETAGLDFSLALPVEHEYRYWSTIQELNGAVADVPHMAECVIQLDKLLAVLRDEIEPMLPPTLTYKGGKISTHDAATLMGSKNPPPRKYEWRKRKGEDVKFEVKPWHKPTMKTHKVTKGKLYAIQTTNGDMVTDYIYPKLKEARDMAKVLCPDEKKIKYPSKPIETKTLDRHTVNHFGEEALAKCEIKGPYTKIVFEDSRMSQHEQIKLLLVGLGWDTDEWTFKKDSEDQFIRAESSGIVYWPKYQINGNQLSERYKAGERIPSTPKITEDSFVTLPDGLGQKIKEYNTYSHRRKFIQNPTDDEKGLLNNVREDGRISCGLSTFGTTAGRAAQYGWVNAPGVKALYGKQIRKIIVAPKGTKLIGVDMPSAHPRLLADFTQNETFIAAVDGKEERQIDGKDVYEGEDVHSVNSVIFELNTEAELQECRDTQEHGELRHKVDIARGGSKGPFYCILYGGAAKKLALILGCTIAKAEELKESFLSTFGLDGLLTEVSSTWKSQKRGRGSYISVLGGYHIWSNSKHKIINYKALGSEAVVQKYAVIWLCREMRDRGLKSKLICNVHDEVLLEVPDKEIEEMKSISSRMYVEAANQLGLTLDWISVAKVGDDYASCH